VLEGKQVGKQKAFLRRRGEGDHQRPVRVAQPHEEDLHFLALSIRLYDRFAPIDPGVLARLECERQEDLLDVIGLLLAMGQVASQIRFAAPVAFRPQDLEDLVGGVALFVEHPLVLLQRGIDTWLIGTGDVDRFGVREMVRFGERAKDRLLDGLVTVAKLLGNLVDAFFSR
jgi:hypothetical protein